MKNERQYYDQLQSEPYKPQKLKLYGPLKISKSEAILEFEQPKSVYFISGDNKWNNPSWMSKQTLAMYHNDKLRRDCVSLEKLMKKTISEEKDIFNNKKKFIESSKQGFYDRYSQRVKERTVLQEEAGQSVLDQEAGKMQDALTKDTKPDIQTTKRLVLARSHLLNNLDKPQSNAWNNFKNMSKKYIDQTVFFLFVKKIVYKQGDSV